MAFTPTAFGKYYLVDKIATGGMAEIFKAKTYSHGGFENLLVIKRILPHISENEDFVEMFIDEAKVSVALQHANIVRVYDFGKIHDNFFIAMECVDGKDVRDVLRKLARRRSYLPPQFAAYVAHEVCKGLHYAHTKTDLHGNPQGIVHRDISPSNVLVAYEGDVKIADFGIAKAESNAYQTRDGVLKGKYEYMSPEQAHGLEIDHRSDIFSAGIILYETLTGRRLFKGDSDVATLERIRACRIRPPGELNPAIPEALDAICMRALERDRDRRYRSALHMMEDLRQFLHPLTPDDLRRQFAGFMEELFREEIREERARLAAHSALARRLRDQAPDTWDTDSTLATPTHRPPPRRALPVLPFAAGLLLLSAAGATWLLLPPDAGTEPEAQRTATLDVLVMPAARILVDGVERGVGDALTLSGLEPGTHTVRLEAEGFATVEEAIELTPGGEARIRHTLERLPEPPRPRTTAAPADGPAEPPADAAPPEVRIVSTPPGATVLVDGREVGTTPLVWRDGAVGGTYAVTLRLDGHEPVAARIADLPAGRTTFERTLPELARPGSLTVTLSGGGWAHVYVDGRKLDRTAPLKGLALEVGEHEIRVENLALGIDHTERVRVGSGEEITIRAVPQ